MPTSAAWTTRARAPPRPACLWAGENSNGRMDRLVWDGDQFARDTANGWSAGKVMRYPNGAGRPDAEGVGLTDAGAAGGVYVSTERDMTGNSVSRPSVLRYDVSGGGTRSAPRGSGT